MTPLSFHGKEGVDGSSPSEGSGWLADRLGGRGFSDSGWCAGRQPQAGLETIWKSAAWFCSLTGARAGSRVCRSPGCFLLFVRSALNRESSTPRRETVLDGPSSDGEYPAGGDH